MTTPRLTIITVVMNDPSGMTRTLASLATQDLTDVEYVVVDSSNDRQLIPHLLTSSTITGTVIWTEPRGIYSAMNEGLRHATGDYVYFLNAGDEMIEGSVSTVMRALDRNSFEWAHAPVEITDSHGGSVVTPAWDYEKEREYAFARGHFPAHQGTVVLTETLRSMGGFDETYQVAADYAAFLTLTQRGAPAIIATPLARFHRGGVSTTRWARALREFHRARREILDLHGDTARRERISTLRQVAATAVHRSPWPLAVGLAAGTLVLLGLTGVAWATAFGLTLSVTVQALGGALWWRLLRPGRSVPILEAIGMGIGLGTAGSLLIGLIAPWWLASALALAAWYSRRLWLRVPTAPLAPVGRSELAGMLAGVLVGVGTLLVAFRAYPLAWVGRWEGYHGDMPFFEAVGASVATLGVGQSIFLEGAGLRYHVLVYGWAGQLTLSTDAAPFVVLVRLLPIVTLIGIVAVGCAWTRHVTRVSWAPAFAGVLLVVGGFVGTTFGGVFNFDSPSQTMTTLWVLVLSVLLLQATTPGTWIPQAVSAFVLGLVVTGGKVSSAAVVVGAWGLVVTIGLIGRAPWWRRALGVGVPLLGGSMVAYFWLLAGSANAGGLELFTLLDRASSVQGLNPVVTPRGIAAGILLLIIAALPRWAGVVWFGTDRTTRRSVTTAYAVGLVLVGVGSIVILSGGFNDLWFAVAASAPLAVLSAVGIAQAVTWLGPEQRSRVILVVVLALAAAVVVAGVWATGSTGVIGDGWRWAGPIIGLGLGLLIGVCAALPGRAWSPRSALAFTIIALVVMALPSRAIYAIAEPFSRATGGIWSPVLFTTQDDFVTLIDQDRTPGWTDQQAAAGAWLRANSRPDDLVATNTTRSALVPALTRLPTFASDLRLQTPYGRAEDVALALSREADAWLFIDAPSEDSFAPLCAAGVDWIWVDPERTPVDSWEPFATPVWTSPDAIILAMNSSLCGTT